MNMGSMGVVARNRRRVLRVRGNWIKMWAATSIFALLFISLPVCAAPVRIRLEPHATARENFGAQRLRGAVAAIRTAEPIYILVGVQNSPVFAHFPVGQLRSDAAEAFLLRRIGNTILVVGSDSSGVLYGELELASRIQTAHALPAKLDFEDRPALKLRGACIGMQKTEITYDDAVYDYPYTHENFPFFYDKTNWTRYLDMLVDKRMNALYLWNGHPFTSLLKLPKYPEAQELPAAQLEQNIAMFKWLTEEADKRGIWVVQGFYNIHLPHPLARAHHLPYHLSAPTPLASQYTRYAISEFIKNYPNVGLLITLGEAMAPQYGAEWLTQTIIPGIHDGMHELGITKEPPIVVREQATDIAAALAAAKPLYSNLDTMYKWSGESYTWTDIRGPVLDKFKLMIANSNVTVANLHLLSNLEPFRWGNPEFIRETALNFQKIGIQGVHVYPLRYWDWPVSADNPPLQQIDRDWIWYEAWGRYAWNPHRDPETEKAYWVERFAARFGTQAAGEHLLAAYNLSGICAPKLLPRIGITEGNRQAFSLGMLMTQLIDDKRYNPATTLWTGNAPSGERLVDYVEREVNHQPHDGETPVGIADLTADSSAKAVAEAEAAAPYITRNRDEYARIVNDVRCIHILMLFYQAKIRAAEQVMTYGYDHDPARLSQAGNLLAQSVESYRQLVSLTGQTYRQACALNTPHLRIPLTGGPGKNTIWRDILPAYQKELDTFRKQINILNAAGPAAKDSAAPSRLPQVRFQLAAGHNENFTVQAGAQLSIGGDVVIRTLAPELDGLTGIRVSPQQHGPIRFTLDQPAQVLVGFFKTRNGNPPGNKESENWNPLMVNAVSATGAPPFTVWVEPLPAGVNDLDLGNEDFVILGFIPQDLKGKPQIASPSGGNQQANLDWLFED